MQADDLSVSLDAGYVREPAKGFFISGSSIPQLNGIYDRVESFPRAINRQLALAYVEERSRWILGLAREDHENGHEEEWLLIDNKHVHRFQHEGHTILPGTGRRWSHLHPGMPQEEADAIEDDFAELPWQAQPSLTHPSSICYVSLHVD